MIVRGTDLTRLMVTLGVALVLLELANKLDWHHRWCRRLQGVMGPLLGRFEFDLGADVRRGIRWRVLVIFLLARRVVHSPLGATLHGAARQPAARDGGRHSGVNARLAAVYTLAAGVAGQRPAPAGTDHRLCLARRVSTAAPT
jgi:branched-chain amino acid transport system permease protein